MAGVVVNGRPRFDVGDIEHVFSNHPPETPIVGARLDKVTALMIDTATQLVEVCPPSYELAKALDHLREASMWAKGALVCHQEPDSIGPR